MCRTIATFQPPEILFANATPTEFAFPLACATLPLFPKELVNVTEFEQKPTTSEPKPTTSEPKPTQRKGLQYEQNEGGVAFKDGEFTREVKDRVAQLICTAMSAETTSSVNARLARKALTYRKIEVAY